VESRSRIGAASRRRGRRRASRAGRSILGEHDHLPGSDARRGSPAAHFRASAAVRSPRAWMCDSRQARRWWSRSGSLRSSSLGAPVGASPQALGAHRGQVEPSLYSSGAPSGALRGRRRGVPPASRVRLPARRPRPRAHVRPGYTARPPRRVGRRIGAAESRGVLRRQASAPWVLTWDGAPEEPRATARTCRSRECAPASMAMSRRIRKRSLTGHYRASSARTMRWRIIGVSGCRPQKARRRNR